jgi:hypothetical protein
MIKRTKFHLNKHDDEDDDDDDDEAVRQTKK